MIAAGSHCQVSADSPSTAAAILALDLQGPFARFERLENRLADLNDELQGELEIAHPHGELETELADLETRKAD